MEVLIVGTGLAGCLAAHFESLAGNNVHMIERSKQFGGLCRSEKVMGIDVHAHGPHVFHTNDSDVWRFVNEIAPFEEYFIKVNAHTNGKNFSFPINLNTLRQLGLANDESQAKAYFEAVKTATRPTVEGLACSTVGERLYELFIKDYTLKQWGCHPSMLPAAILKRIPYRTTSDDRYYDDKYSGIPKEGWTKFLNQLVRNVDDIRLDTKMSLDELKQFNGKVIYTGRLDELSRFVLGPLPFRTVYHRHEIYPTIGRLQPVPVINYCDLSVKFTRTIEHKLLCNDKQVHDLPQTVISFEYPNQSTKDDVPCYPIEIQENLNLQLRYESMFNETGFVKFGRLASYRYMNMNQVVEQVLNAYL